MNEPMVTRKVNVLAQPNERVITSRGDVAIVSFSMNGVVYALGPTDRVPRPIVVRGNAYGGEHDMALGLDK